MDKRTKDKIIDLIAPNVITDLINRDFQAALNSLTNEELEKLGSEMMRSPSLILETQQRLLALSLKAFGEPNWPTVVKQLVGTARALSAVTVGDATARKIREAQKEG